MPKKWPFLSKKVRIKYFANKSMAKLETENLAI